jgi:ATP-dependent Clp protease ATP-binding subunit ClpA
MMAIEHREVIIIHGNVRDRYIDPKNNRVYENLTELIRDLWKKKYSRIILYDNVGQERIFEETKNSQKQGDQIEQTIPPAQIFAKWGKKYLNSSNENTLATIFYLDKLVSYKNSYAPDEMELILRLEKIIENITSNNRLIMVALRDTMIPVELYTNSPKTALISIPIPDKDDRELYLKHKLGEHPYIAFISAQTEGLYLRDLDSISTDIKKITELGPSEIKKIINKYRLGEQEDHWGKLDLERIDGAKNWFIKEGGIKGQDDAVDKIIDTVTMARAGFSGMSSDTTSKPKGVLFFAGPTGVGKTFLAKLLAEFLFGSKEEFIRFDMSEFKEEHTISKFIGSPPGYVGYERGGLLTNAVREKPFSVILFDEIEKAHPKIMDMFLQILDEGRLTDSRGQTVFFTESVIVFTSNIGTRTTDSRGQPIQERTRIDEISDKKINETEKEAQIKEHFLNSVENYFMYEISRPELLNRIGNNIIPFNYISAPEIQKEIIKSKLNQIKNKFNEDCKSDHLQLIFSESIVDHILKKSGDKIAKSGGRSVNNIIDDEILIGLAKLKLRAEYEKMSNVTFSIELTDGKISGNIK